jgi:hypothetical protein
MDLNWMKREAQSAYEWLCALLILCRVHGTWMSECGGMVKQYWQQKTEVCHLCANAGISRYGGPFAVRGTRHGGGWYSDDFDGWMKKGSSGGVPLCEGLH